MVLTNLDDLVNLLGLSGQAEGLEESAQRCDERETLKVKLLCELIHYRSVRGSTEVRIGRIFVNSVSNANAQYCIRGDILVSTCTYLFGALDEPKCSPTFPAEKNGTRLSSLAIDCACASGSSSKGGTRPRPVSRAKGLAFGFLLNARTAIMMRFLSCFRLQTAAAPLGRFASAGSLKSAVAHRRAMVPMMFKIMRTAKNLQQTWRETVCG